MNGELAQLDREIAGLENDLAKKHQRRIEILEAQLKEAQERAGIIAPSAPAPRRGRPAKTASTSAPAPSKKKAGKKKGAKKKRTRMASEDVDAAIREALQSAGSEGLSLIDVSTKSGVNYQTAAKKLKELPGIKKTGKLKQARYTIK